ncbi:hypothetical protein HHK36_021942 [Tetracentron sinense]|uniref:Uncharacterized protein n=1 Tax=Tetracentron sinense TaxID=13715 RepID=A0A834YT31_TETSI|nr:hypothetical protein HHK36_021942 [Tetracentron sinense]
MALRCFPPHIIKQCGPIRKPVGRVFMPHQSQFPANKPPQLQIRFSRDNKVFEDESRGIICYRDESGEIICEGYDDESPRFHQQVPKTASDHLRDIGILDIFQQGWFQIPQGKGIHHVDVDEGGVVQEDFDWSVFNRLC